MGIGLVIIGAALVLLSFTSLEWYSGAGGPDSQGSIGFSDLHHNAVALGTNSITIGYFSWISWLLLILVISVGTAANVFPEREGIRVGGLFVGLVGMALTYYALHESLLSGSILDHASAGIYLTFLGYLVAGVGSVLGPWPWRRTRAVADPPPPEPPAEPPVRRRPSPS